MRNLFVLGLVGLAVWGGISFFNKQQPIDMYEEGGSFIMERGSGRVIAKNQGEFSADLRLFGFSEMPGGEIGAMDFLTHMLIVTPVNVSSGALAKLGCEKNAVDQSSMLQTIVLDPEGAGLLKDIEDVEDRRCIRIEARSLKVKQSTYKGEVVTVSAMPGGFRNDMNKIILVDRLESISCD